MNRLEPDSDMGCWAGHKDRALRSITNQGFGEEPKKWLTWWEKNKNKSQEEWIRDGFMPYGLDLEIPRKPEQSPPAEAYQDYFQDRAKCPSPVENPPSREQVDALLALLGAPEEDESKEADQNQKDLDVPDYIKYNAFRWLRDTGFDPVDYLLVNQSVSDGIARGIRRYYRFEHESPACLYLGILPFGQTREDINCALPPMCTNKFQVVALLVIFVPMVVGLGLILWSRHKRAAES